MSTIALRRLGITLGIAGLLALAHWQPLQTAGADRIDTMFGRALATFATARALNGVISVIQGTEIALQPAGVGVTLTVGELLDPINDLVERFSWVMLAATTALGAQSILLAASADGLLAALLLGLGAVVVLREWWRPLARLDRRGLLPRLLILLLFVRLALPLAAIGAHAFSERFLEPQRQAAVAGLELTRAELDAIESEAPELVDEDDPDARSAPGVFDSMRRYMQEQRSRFDLKQRLEALGERLDVAAENVVDLVVVFLLQTIIVPLAVIWALWRLTRMLQPGFPPGSLPVPTRTPPGSP